MRDKDSQTAKEIGPCCLFGMLSSLLKLVMKEACQNYKHGAFKYPMDGKLIFRRSSASSILERIRIDQRKIFLPNQEGKFHNISANHAAELKLCYFLRFLKFFIPTCHYFHSSQQILMIFRKLISVARRERNDHLLEICIVMFTNL